MLCRHPFDVLISILHFAPHEPATARWLDGVGGDESAIIGRSPASAAFLRYALSRRASALLEVSRQWWDRPGVIRIHYHDLVANPRANVERVAHVLGRSAEPSTVEEAVAGTSLEALRATSTNQHFWRGTPALWRQLLPTSHVMVLSHHYRHLLRHYGFNRWDVPPFVSTGAAKRAWATANDPNDGDGPRQFWSDRYREH